MSIHSKEYMSEDHKLSLPAAIIININIMLGAGIFINTVELAKRAGTLGGFAYLLIGVLLLPLIISIAHLMKMYPDGGFYTFARMEISPFVGFFSTWSYFVAKLASATLMIHASVLLLQQLIPVLAIIHALILDSMILTLFTILNMLNIRTGSYIQAGFMGLKLTPIVFAIITGLFLLFGGTAAPINFVWSGIASSIPLVLYAATGFEATCSLSSRIKDAHRNGPLAIFISYSIVITIAFLYQIIFYTSLGDKLAQATNYLFAFPTLTATLLPSDLPLAHNIFVTLHLAIASSALSGAYGILFSNNWNLYTLAQYHHVLFSSYMTKLNKHFIPFACVIIEGLLCALYLAVTYGATVALQQVAAMGSTIAYTLSVLALCVAKYRRPEVTINAWIPALGFIICLILIGFCIRNFIIAGILSPLIAFLTLLIFGVGMFWFTQETIE